MQKRCTVDLWTAGYAGSRLTAQARSPMDKPWTTLRVAHRLPTGRRLPTSSTALNPIVIESGKVKTKTPAPALAYSSPVAVQTTGTTAEEYTRPPSQAQHGQGDELPSPCPCISVTSSNASSIRPAWPVSSLRCGPHQPLDPDSARQCTRYCWLPRNAREWSIPISLMITLSVTQ